jgi:hypothetical protein
MYTIFYRKTNVGFITHIINCMFGSKEIFCVCQRKIDLLKMNINDFFPFFLSVQ